MTERVDSSCRLLKITNPLVYTSATFFFDYECNIQRGGAVQLVKSQNLSVQSYSQPSFSIIVYSEMDSLYIEIRSFTGPFC